MKKLTLLTIVFNLFFGFLIAQKKVKTSLCYVGVTYTNTCTGQVVQCSALFPPCNPVVCIGTTLSFASGGLFWGVNNMPLVGPDSIFNYTFNSAGIFTVNSDSSNAV